MAGIVTEFTHHWYIVASIPIVAAAIGYVTKLVAIRMMFRPLEFIGIPPYLGWQGVVPRRAARMASIAVTTMTRDLITARDVLGRLDPERIAAELAGPMREATDEIVGDVLAEYRAAGAWQSMPEPLRALVVDRVQAELPRIIAAVLASVQDDVDAVFDLKQMVISQLVADKELLNRIFQQSGHKEFAWIARSGIYFGGAIGVLQMILWLVFRNPLIMPIFGLFVGWFTDWLALKLIFNPKQPIRVFGFEIQGLFLKRRREVAADYGALIAQEIITPRAVLAAIVSGPLSDRMFAIVSREIQDAVDRNTGAARPLVTLAVGTRRYAALKETITSKVIARLPDTLGHLEDYAGAAMNIRGLLVSKMQQLDEHQFERLIRPAFESDEWILIAVGALLGFCMGEVQAIVLEHLT